MRQPIDYYLSKAEVALDEHIDAALDRTISLLRDKGASEREVFVEASQNLRDMHAGRHRALQDLRRAIQGTGGRF